jgi:hypothetical protein
MKAYLTFLRKHELEHHAIGVDVKINIPELYLRISGQPLLLITKDNLLLALYLINEEGDLNQVHGIDDYLFNIEFINDLSSINIKKFNTIKYFLLNMYSSLSLSEFSFYEKELLTFENIIFYNLLHVELDVNKIKSMIVKLIKKSDIEQSIQQRFLEKLKRNNFINRKILRKKLDINLSGYPCKIKTMNEETLS